MKPFKAPVDDIFFTLNHVAKAQEIPDWDSEMAQAVIEHFSRFAEDQIAPLNELGDRQGCRLENNRVKLPPEFVECYRSFCEQGWPSMCIGEEHGGQGQKPILVGVVAEIFSGACHSLQMLAALVPGLVGVLERFGTPDQRARFMPDLVSGDALATMCLTEPQAGSDLSQVRTRASENGDHWLINGEKIFISGGDQNLSPKITHLVLARTGSVEEGIKGLSLFICPSHNADATRNGVQVERIEEKMGIHASPTCQLVFSDADAELVGKQGEGLLGMFTMMNHARMDVSLQGVAHATRAADISRSYAMERKQGRIKGHEGSVAIADHADVRRMLVHQDALAIGCRAMTYMTLVMMENSQNKPLVEFLTPVCKAFCTDAGSEAADLAIQVLGGYGFLREFQVEQHWRDGRIARIYEGANGIHAVTLVNRLLRHDNAASANAFFNFIEDEMNFSATAGKNTSHLAKSLEVWNESRTDILAAPDPTQMAYSFMKLTGTLLFLAVWQRIEDAAKQSPESQKYLSTADFVRRYYVPEIDVWAARCRAEI
jgi:3-(methylthio)propanoyl-CoA dehydrogenase